MNLLPPASDDVAARQAHPYAALTPDTPTGPMARLQALPARKKTLLAVGTAGLVAVLVALALWSRQRGPGCSTGTCQAYTRPSTQRVSDRSRRRAGSR